MNGKKCVYENCVRLSSKKEDSCTACRARHRYWDKKSPGRRIERRRKLSLSGETMREFVGDIQLKQFIRKGYKKEVRLNG